MATAPSKPRRPPGSQAPSHPRSRWNRRQPRKSRARGRSCPAPGCPALGPPESGGSGGRQTPLRRASTCGGREGGEPGAGPRGPGEGPLARDCSPVLEPHHGCLHLRRPDAQTGCLLSSAANRKLSGQPLREAARGCGRSPVSVSPELRLFSAVRGRPAQYRADAAGSKAARLMDFCACDGWLCPLINSVCGIWSLHDVYFLTQSCVHLYFLPRS